jgi:hypothetical protein
VHSSGRSGGGKGGGSYGMRAAGVTLKRAGAAGVIELRHDGIEQFSPVGFRPLLHLHRGEDCFQLVGNFSTGLLVSKVMLAWRLVACLGLAQQVQQFP